MQIFYDYNTKIKTNIGIGLGNFDGLHIGHKVLTDTLIKECSINGYKSAIYTFTKHPENILRKKLITPMLITIDKKIELFEETGLDYVFFDEFDEKYSRINADEFVRSILVERLNVRLVTVGFNYRFGYRGDANADSLIEYGKIYGFKVIVIPPVTLDKEIVSSSIIREKISGGDIEEANHLLGREHSITGTVEKGNRMGHVLGFPTANIYPPEYLLLPQNGVYITRTIFEGKVFNSITNIGFKPTMGANIKISIETHLLDFNIDVYGKNIEVFFLHKLRNEKKFKDTNELKKQMVIDIALSRQFFNSRILSANNNN